MKNKRLWLLLLVVGIIPFAAPLIAFMYEMTNSSSWILVDWLILYSFLYWPTYIIGFMLIAISLYKLIK